MSQRKKVDYDDEIQSKKAPNRRGLELAPAVQRDDGNDDTTSPTSKAMSKTIREKKESNRKTFQNKLDENVSSTPAKDRYCVDENLAATSLKEPPVQGKYNRTAGRTNKLQATDQLEDSSSSNEEDSTDHPGAYPISGMGRRGMFSTIEEGTVIYSMGSSNNEAVRHTNNEDLTIYQHGVEEENTAAADGLENNTAIPVAAVLAQDTMEQEVVQRLEEERRQQPVAQAIEMKQRICGTSRGCFIGVLLFGSIIIGLSVGLAVFFTRSKNPVGETLVPSDSSTTVSTISPTDIPTVSPTDIPTVSPSDIPTVSPTDIPTVSPTDIPTVSPTDIPTVSPTDIPTEAMTVPPALSRFDSFVNLIGQNVTQDVNIFYAMSTYEYAAMDWLANNDTWVLDIHSRPVQAWVERYALAFLYFATNGQTWAVDSNFLDTSISVCGWHQGITCEGLFVVGFIFEEGYIQIEGRLPSELALLKSLKVLNLEGNDLSGTLPSDIGLLSNLSVLILDSNNLIGPLPSEIGRLTSLEFLYLESCNLSGSIPSEIGLLTNMNLLKLQSNSLTGAIPSEIGQIGCRSFDLSGLPCFFYLDANALSGTLPTEVGFLTELQELHLQDNKLTGPIPSEVGLLRQVYELDFRNNRLTGPIPSEIGLMGELDDLFLQNNQCTGPIPSEIGLLSGLNRLHLFNNTLSGTFPSELSNLSSLNHALFERNRITGSLDMFCDGANLKPDLFNLWSDCLGGRFPVNCSCCNRCCRTDFFQEYVCEDM